MEKDDSRDRGGGEVARGQDAQGKGTGREAVMAEYLHILVVNRYKGVHTHVRTHSLTPLALDNLEILTTSYCCCWPFAASSITMSNAAVNQSLGFPSCPRRAFLFSHSAMAATRAVPRQTHALRLWASICSNEVANASPSGGRAPMGMGSTGTTWIALMVLNWREGLGRLIEMGATWTALMVLNCSGGGYGAGAAGLAADWLLLEGMKMYRLAGRWLLLSAAPGDGVVVLLLRWLRRCLLVVEE
ncbi:hypothetical protein IWX91DRAFT_177991 [Phyllosticta citricarpa]